MQSKTCVSCKYKFKAKLCEIVEHIYPNTLQNTNFVAKMHHKWDWFVQFFQELPLQIFGWPSYHHFRAKCNERQMKDWVPNMVKSQLYYAHVCLIQHLIHYSCNRKIVSYSDLWMKSSKWCQIFTKNDDLVMIILTYTECLHHKMLKCSTKLWENLILSTLLFCQQIPHFHWIISNHITCDSLVLSTKRLNSFSGLYSWITTKKKSQWTRWTHLWNLQYSAHNNTISVYISERSHKRSFARVIKSRP